jgi:hypothetical protein
LHPREFEGAHYIAIDFAEHATQIRDPRIGLKALYNQDVALDYRRLIGWARDISALTPDEYARLKRPTRIAHFPEDLAKADTLEFSGLYEDGWMSPESKFVLGPSSAHGVIRVKGFVPGLPGTPLGTGNLLLTVDGATFEVPANAGEFDWLVPIAHPGDRTAIGLKFSASTRLPGGDNRPTAAHLELMEVLPGLPVHTFDFATIGSPRPVANGIDQDGWMARQASIVLPPSDVATHLSLRFELPDWSANQKTTVRLRVDGAAAATQDETVAPGNGSFHITVPAATTPRTVHIDADHDFQLAAPDSRRRVGRLLELTLAPDA